MKTSLNITKNMVRISRRADSPVSQVVDPDFRSSMSRIIQNSALTRNLVPNRQEGLQPLRRQSLQSMRCQEGMQSLCRQGLQSLRRQEGLQSLQSLRRQALGLAE